MHSEDPRLLDFRPELLDALGASRVFAMELVPDASMLEQLQQAMYYGRDQRLDQVLDEGLYAQVVELLENYGMGEPAVRSVSVAGAPGFGVARGAGSVICASIPCVLAARRSERVLASP
jgi:hypothetical protein